VTPIFQLEATGPCRACGAVAAGIDAEGRKHGLCWTCWQSVMHDTNHKSATETQVLGWLANRLRLDLTRLTRTGIAGRCEAVSARSTGRQCGSQCKRCAAKLAEMDARAAKSDRKVVGYVDLTPSWTGVLPLYLAALSDGTPTAKAAAREELTRMARLADMATA
jgi:hypothetical protein